MNQLRIAIALVLVLIFPGLAHAVTLRTAPFPGALINSGTGRCVVTNGSERESDRAVVTMFNTDGSILDSTGPFSLQPGESGYGGPVVLVTFGPTWCRCDVPNRQHTCSFVYVNGTTVEIIRAE